MSNLARKLKKRMITKLVTEINGAEMACRIFEHVSGTGPGQRPYPTSPELSMAVLQRDDPEIHRRLMAAAESAITYIHECINKGQVPS